jgi:hypothetical protein
MEERGEIWSYSIPPFGMPKECLQQTSYTRALELLRLRKLYCFDSCTYYRVAESEHLNNALRLPCLPFTSSRAPSPAPAHSDFPASANFLNFSPST